MSNIKNNYVVLTGDKNNSGDYLIKKAGLYLLNKYRPDRVLTPIPAWEPLNKERLRLVNESCALILLGGPALQPQMYPCIYPLTRNLNDIKAPIITMGIGAKPKSTYPEAPHHYPLTDQTHELLTRINRESYQSSLRDYYSGLIMQAYGYNNFITTGCPAFYLNEDQSQTENSSPNSIVFSVGVNFAKETDMLHQTKDIIYQMITELDQPVRVAFHHSTTPKFLNTHRPNVRLYDQQHKLIEWLKEHKIEYIDISGSAEQMLSLYSSCSLHIGYRVHAHILTSSLGKPSLLLAEDGRAINMKDVMGGMILNAYEEEGKGLIPKVLKASGLSHRAKPELWREIQANLAYEKKAKNQRTLQVANNLRMHFYFMKSFLDQLP
ncbi:polysaccharide pyruvyl transferase family protein [Hahella chejuensis]|nr:polysaccharide pyruvyl transferase family protein [Hahella chejuensis]